MREQPTETIYTANERHQTGFFITLKVILRDSWEYRELIIQLYKRDFLMRYRKSFVGTGWILLAPLVSILSWILMNAAGILQPGETDIPYPVWVLLGTTFWTLFLQFFNLAGNTLQEAQSYIQQINFPHEILLFKQGLVALTGFIISMVLNVIVMLIFGVIPSPYITLLPLFALPILCFAGALGIIVSLLKTLTTDFDRITGFLTHLWMFITPVIYTSQDKAGWLQIINRINPLTWLISTPRDLIFLAYYYNITYYILTILFSLGLLISALVFFYRHEKRVVERMI